MCVRVYVQTQGSNYRDQWWVQRGRCTLLGWYVEKQVLSSKTREVVEHAWQMSSLLSMAQPGLWCFPLGQGVLNHFLENANAPTVGSTNVLNGLRPVVWSMERGRSGAVACHVDHAKVSHLVATIQSLSWALGRYAGPCSLALVKVRMPGPRSPLGHE